MVAGKDVDEKGRRGKKRSAKMKWWGEGERREKEKEKIRQKKNEKERVTQKTKEKEKIRQKTKEKEREGRSSYVDGMVGASQDLYRKTKNEE